MVSLFSPDRKSLFLYDAVKKEGIIFSNKETVLMYFILPDVMSQDKLTTL